MNITFSPQRNHLTSVSDEIEVINSDMICINGQAYHADASLSVINGPYPIIGGSRDSDGQLSLTVRYGYCAADVPIWETPPYRGVAPEILAPTGNPISGSIIEMTGQTGQQLLSIAIANLCAQADYQMTVLLKKGFALQLSSGAVQFSATDDHQLDATGILVEISIGSPPAWPYPWADANDSTVTFASQEEFLSYVSAFRSTKQAISESVGVVKTQIRSATSIAEAQDIWTEWILTNGGQK